MVDEEIGEKIVAREHKDVPVPVCGRGINSLAKAQRLSRAAVSARLVMAHMIAIEDVKGAVLAAHEEQVGFRKKQRPSRTDIGIARVEGFLVRGSEIIAYHQVSVVDLEFENAVAVVMAATRSIELPVAGRGIDIALLVRGRAVIGLPDAALASVRAKYSDTAVCLRLRFVISHAKTVIRVSTSQEEPQVITT